jgi:two-component system sensor histidine kinase HydH
MSVETAQPQKSPLDYAKRIEELGRIILAYSEITEKLQQSHEELQQTVELLKNELSDKNRQLERKNRLAALGEMAAGIAHEIRNPLGGIQLYASILAKDLQGAPKALEIVTKISSGVRRLEGLVSQVLQFSREIVARIAPVNLAELLDNVVELASPHAEAKQIAIEVDGPRPLRVEADRNLLEQSILNLVLNAIEAMHGPGAVRVTYFAPPASSDAKQFHLIVRDTGPGIPAEILDRIFNPFFTTKDKGTGLGLAIVHRIIESHNGTISATNDPLGGAKFEVRI